MNKTKISNLRYGRKKCFFLLSRINYHIYPWLICSKKLSSLQIVKISVNSNSNPNEISRLNFPVDYLLFHLYIHLITIKISYCVVLSLFILIRSNLFCFSFSQPMLKCEVSQCFEKQKLNDNFRHTPKICVIFHHQVTSNHLRFAIMTINVLRRTNDVRSSGLINCHHDRLECVLYSTKIRDVEHVSWHMLMK